MTKDEIAKGLGAESVVSGEEIDVRVEEFMKKLLEPYQNPLVGGYVVGAVFERLAEYVHQWTPGRSHEETVEYVCELAKRFEQHRVEKAGG